MNMPLVLLNRRRRGGSASAPAFSPSTLFSSTAIGIWLDPSDLSTMFSDRAGTTPVTAPGTVVGLRLDKSKGLVLGAELVTNGTFDSGITGWTAYNGSTLSYVSGRLRSTNSVAFGGVVQSFAVVIGRTYKFQFSLYKGTSSSMRAEVGFSEASPHNYNSGLLTADVVDRSVVFVATHSPTFVTFRSDNADKYIDIDNISVRELAGNHAVAPTDAARPTYGVEPKGGRRNLLTYSEAFDNAVWNKQGGTTISATQYLAPNGTMTADKLVSANSTTVQPIVGQTFSGVVAGSTYSVSLWVKADGFGFASISGTGYESPASIPWVTVNLSDGSTQNNANATNVSTVSEAGWYRVRFSFVAAYTMTSASVRIALSSTNAAPAVSSSGNTVTGDGTSGILIWGAQLELGSTATNYQRVTTAYDVTESGVPTCHYVQYDGSDDSMSTAAIDFTATDKMSVFAGVRKLSDAAVGMLLELSPVAFSNNGAFFITAGEVTGNGTRYGYASRGTAFTYPGTADTAFNAPTSDVLTGLSDIAGDRATLRIDGTQVAQSTADQGTGNYGNYPLFIGRRNNATLPFNGRDYGIIVVGKAATTTEITDTETWLAAKTAQVTL